jgi:hypothetical protein
MSAPTWDLKRGDPVTIRCLCGDVFQARVGESFTYEVSPYGQCVRHRIMRMPTGTDELVPAVGGSVDV